MPDADEAFHVYAVEYDAASVRYYLDDVEVARLPKFTDGVGNAIEDCTLRAGQTYTIHPELPASGVPLNVIINLAVRGSHVDKRIKGLPLVMEVDWVRVWGIE